MNKQEEILFDALSIDRAESADTIDKPSMRGIKNSVVDKYSDQAHFIYELLQNADDVQATAARFVLEPTQLFFAHNGKKLFSISDPATENDDSDNGNLGHINAITSIGNSTKTEASIGKFGIGFKAVFQYTSTPHVYDPNFRFKIERLFVPKRIDTDCPLRRPEETAFVFPFDHPERNAAEAYTDISDKLRNLSFPLLFLSSLKEIEFQFGDVIGLYGKKIVKTYCFEDITAEHICLTQNNGGDLYDEHLWLFSKLDDSQRRYSVGFFLDEHNVLRPVNEHAFCYFPTKETTGLNFIVHAPFLLTNSREGIRAGVPHNEKMVKLLADLAAQAIVLFKKIGELESTHLIDDGIIKIIPYYSGSLGLPNSKSKISFFPFYESIRTVFETEEILPSTDGYVSAKNAYWADVPQLPQLFTNLQLRDICDNASACWVFTSISRDDTQRANKSLFSYIDTLVRTSISDEVILSGRTKSSFYNRSTGKIQDIEPLKGITAQFIEGQSLSWLHQFYHWIADSKDRTKIIKKRPVFLDQNLKASSAIDEAGQPILFLPADHISGYTVVHPDLLENPETKSFLEEIGVKPPSLRDHIYNVIRPMYANGGEIDEALADTHFRLFFDYYCNCPTDECDEYIGLIKGYEFLTYYHVGDPQPHRGAAGTMYLPNPELKRFFKPKPETRFVAFEEYLKLVGENREKQLIQFFTELGIRREPVTYCESDSGYYRKEQEGFIDGLLELIDFVELNKDISYSVFLWKQLCTLADSKRLSQDVLHKTIESRPNGRYRFRPSYEISSTAIALQSKMWITDSVGNFVAPNTLSKEKLSSIYDLSFDGATALLPLLGIIEDDDSNLTDSQRERIQFADKLMAEGINESDLEELKRIKRQREVRQQTHDQNTIGEKIGTAQAGDAGLTDDGFLDIISSSAENSGNENKAQKKLNKTTSDVVWDIARRTKEQPSATSSDTEEPEEDIDQDEFMPSSVDYGKRIEQAKRKSAAEIDKIAYLEELQKRAKDLQKYSFGWFKALLEMESLHSGENNSRSKEVSISFAKVEREPGTTRTLVLKHPNRYIPQFIEDLADIPLVLHMGDAKKTVAIEVASIQSYTLRVKLRSGTDIEGVDFSSVNAATIDAKSPAFLLEELRRQFSALKYADDFDMRENLCENIEFVFGPPGTGKTTHLAKNVLLPLMMEQQACRVLVLTPTNKAADVLVRKIMEVSGEDHSYDDWLVRFGATGDEEIEQSPVFRDKTFDIRTLSKCVTITTIARFPYDFFMPQGARLFLDAINWDFIVIDEASMIPLANIVYPLYKKTPQKFIIAGDPFQIEPITSVDLWKNENIYTLVQLDSFVHPSTVPHPYKVELLTTQYRSIPEIGGIFSRFAYGGILNHYRESSSQRLLNVGNGLNIKALNIIKYPVSKYESIYRAKRLQHSSSYQIYSALFTYEYICFLSKALATANPGSLFKIGIIAPYRAQADLIDKLLASENLPKEVDVQVGTIHGFQGDECDIIFAVFNTPPTISVSNEMFLNKRNIINVSISRARDYLFLIMPDDETENIGNLRLVKHVESLVKGTHSWTESYTPDLETLMFGVNNYLENNAFSTSHQSVNVYGLPEKCYEVRTEDNAVDIQILREGRPRGQI
jgi:hypothetical protein